MFSVLGLLLSNSTAKITIYWSFMIGPLKRDWEKANALMCYLQVITFPFMIQVVWGGGGGGR